MTSRITFKQLNPKRPRLQYVAATRLHCPILEFKRVETPLGTFYWDQTRMLPGLVSGLFGGMFGFLAGVVAGFQALGGLGGLLFGLLGCALGSIAAAVSVVRVK